MKRIIALLMMLLIIFSVSGCINKDTEENSNGYSTVYDFEKGIQGVRMVSDYSRSFGRITINEDNEFVKSGKRSIKLEPGNKIAQPYMFLPFKSDFIENENFSQVDKIIDITLSVYSTEKTMVGIGMYFTDRAEDKSVATVYNLNKGWNELTYINELPLVLLQYEVKAFKGIYFRYEDMESLPVVYMDDVKVRMNKVALPIYDMMSPKITNDYYEISDFELTYQHAIFSATSMSAYLPEVSTVNAQDEGLTAPSGERILKIVTAENATGPATWTSLWLTGKSMQNIRWDLFASDLEKYEFKFDLYQKSEKWVYLEVDLYGDNVTPPYAAVSVTSTKDKWVSVGVKMTAFEAFVSKPGVLRFVWQDVGDSEHIIYLDNIRIEKVR